MTDLDLTAVTASNTALQKDTKAALTVRKNAAATLAVLQQLAPPALSNPIPPPGGDGVYFGADIDGDPTMNYYYPNEAPWADAPWDYRTWDRFERDAGKRVALVMFGQPAWMTSIFPKAALDAVHARGAIPVLDVMTDNIPLIDIIAGRYDTQITAWARAAAAVGYPFFLRWNCEPNGDWYGYAKQAAKDPTLYVKAWQHTHDLFTAVGALNVCWHWAPNIDVKDPDYPRTPLEALYPGHPYTDWTGPTGYQQDARSFKALFLDTYARIAAVAPGKPMMIGETASYGQYRPQFLTEFFATLPTLPLVKAFCWFNWRLTEGGVLKDWPIQAAALAQFKAGVAAARYIGRP